MYLLLVITLLDGSSVNLKVNNDTAFDVQTKYGALKIPLKEARDITFGIHVDNPEQFINAVKSLGNEKYGDRVSSTKFLKDNPRGAWKYIQPLQKDPDQEINKRVQQLIDGMGNRPPILDSIAISSGYMSGEIKQTEIEGVSESLGPLKIKMSQVKLIVCKQPERDVELDAANSEWQEVGQVFDGHVTINATGQVDIWPQGPGQYVCGPKGYTTAGKGGIYPAGALMGRGSDNKEFVVGDFFTATNLPRGKLELRIIGSPWNNVSSGTYKIRIE